MKWIPKGENYNEQLGLIKSSPIADGYLILNFKYCLNLINRHLGIRNEYPSPYIKFKPHGAFQTDGPDEFYSTAIASNTTDPLYNQVIRVGICCNKEEGAY